MSNNLYKLKGKDLLPNGRPKTTSGLNRLNKNSVGDKSLIEDRSMQNFDKKTQ